MGRINILDKHVAELIAAGEVVERPSSVIKELTENSIDAGATAVTVEIKNGGVTFMRVTDNGSGILREDIRPAFVRHATSKVREADDLDAISTLGFRGEALASVSSVSHLELITKAREEDIGTRYLIEGGEEIAFDEAGCPDGTTFIIRDLFYNVPARMKFLKTDMAEGNAVSNVIDKLALSHPEIAIIYIKDGKTVLRTAGDGKILSAIYAVYGREFASSLIPVDYTLGGIRVSGYLSRPEYARPNRNMQNFFINHRFVICKTAMAAIGEACKGSVMVGKFPSCVINIDIAFGAVDVNVHPTKLEVRFVNERPVFDAVYHAVKTALLTGEKRVEAVKHEPQKTRVNPFELAQKIFREKDGEKADVRTAPAVKQATKPANDTKKADELFRMLDDVEKEKSDPPTEKAVAAADEHPDRPGTSVQVAEPGAPIVDQYKRMVSEHRASSGPMPEPLVPPKKKQEPIAIKQMPMNDSVPQPLIDTDDNGWRYVGEAFRTYIIIEKNPRELVLIDKHAAHERIIYERLKKEKGGGYAQLLLTPVTVTLNKTDYNAVIGETEVFADAGFDIEDFGDGTVIVRSAPQYLSAEDIEPSVIEMAGYLSENRREILSEKMEWIYHNVACRAAVKGGNISTEKELIALARQVEDEDVRHCPHGRPVCVVVKKREIERWFGRV
jgi:DNA mismatch repair protein MutL